MNSLFENQQYSDNNFFLLAGPCVVEGQEITFEIARKIKTICESLHIPFVFKASYKKANRTSIESFTGIGNQEALEILGNIRKELKVPVVTDIHSEAEAKLAANYVDILQIPAFLCRQTDLLLAAAATGRWVNIKKGQFLSPESMRFALEKVKQTGNQFVMATERGTTFGYQDLVVDFRSVPIMKLMNVPVVVDCTHSLQQPNQSSGITGGDPSMIATIARAAIAVGADGLFIETHPRPDMALSDGANMLQLDHLEPLLNQLVKIREVVNLF